MTHRGPFQPRPFCDSVILRWGLTRAEQMNNFLLPNRLRSECKRKLLLVPRCYETGQLTQLQGWFFMKDLLFCCFTSTFIQWRQNKQGENGTGSSYKMIQTSEHCGAGLFSGTSCPASPLLHLVLSMFHAAKFLLRFFRRLKIQRFIIL